MPGSAQRQGSNTKVNSSPNRRTTAFQISSGEHQMRQNSFIALGAVAAAAMVTLSNPSMAARRDAGHVERSHVEATHVETKHVDKKHVEMPHTKSIAHIEKKHAEATHSEANEPAEANEASEGVGR
jgi:hypothetical protein